MSISVIQARPDQPPALVEKDLLCKITNLLHVTAAILQQVLFILIFCIRNQPSFISFPKNCAPYSHHFKSEICITKWAKLKHYLKWVPKEVGSVKYVARDWRGRYLSQNSFIAQRSTPETELAFVVAPLLYCTESIE